MPPPLENVESPSSRFWEVFMFIALVVLISLNFIHVRVGGMVVLITSKNETLPFPDTEAGFAERVPGSGMSGLFFQTYPPNACDPILNGPGSLISTVPVFAIVERGDCNFNEKVLNAQDAGFSAVVVFDNKDGHDMVEMTGSSDGVRIPAVFVSKSAGETLLDYSKQIGARCYILPAINNTAWSVVTGSCISLLAVTVVLTIFTFIRGYRWRRLGSRLLLVKDSVGMSSREVKALPTIIFKCSGDGQCASETCAICLEDYESGEKLRVLPCRHDFHTACIDQWLTTRRPFCPVCKRDVHRKNQDPPPSENTPLLAAVAAAAAAPVGLLVPVLASSIPAATQTSPVGSLDDARGSSLIETPTGSPESCSSMQSSSVCAFGFHSAPDTFLQIDDSATSNLSPGRRLATDNGENLC